MFQLPLRWSLITEIFDSNCCILPLVSAVLQLKVTLNVTHFFIQNAFEWSMSKCIIRVKKRTGWEKDLMTHCTSECQISPACMWFRFLRQCGTYWSQHFKHNHLIGQEIKHIMMCVQRSESHVLYLESVLSQSLTTWWDLQNSDIHFIRGMSIKVSTRRVLIFSNGQMKEMFPGWFDL